jgi:hypothetical protein
VWRKRYRDLNLTTFAIEQLRGDRGVACPAFAMPEQHDATPMRRLS